MGKPDCWRIRASPSPVMSAIQLAESFNIKLQPLPAPLPENEPDRIQVLRELNILDTLPEAHFDKIVTIAQQVSACPIVYIAMVDSDRLWFKASIGVKNTEGPRETSFCAHTILIDPSESEFLIKNAANDPRFSGNDKVLGGPRIRFYCGFPLEAEGQRVGTLCVIDRKPRSLDDVQMDKLKNLAKIVSLYLSLRLVMQRLIKIDLNKKPNKDQSNSS